MIASCPARANVFARYGTDHAGLGKPEMTAMYAGDIAGMRSNRYHFVTVTTAGMRSQKDAVGVSYRGTGEPFHGVRIVAVVTVAAALRGQ